MTRILGISGSLRAGSFNTALLRAAVEVAPHDTELQVDTIAGIPLYDGDVEASLGVPDIVDGLKNRIIAADGLLLVTPEYNNSVPGVLKNAIDWLSRPPADIARVFGGRPVALMGASQGRYGTVLAQAAWLPVLKTLGMELWSGRRLLVPHAKDLFDDSGRLVDAETRERLKSFIGGFVEFVATHASR